MHFKSYQFYRQFPDRISEPPPHHISHQTQISQLWSSRLIIETDEQASSVLYCNFTVSGSDWNFVKTVFF